MIHVQISDTPIPEGYTYQRCDEYTKDELLAIYTPAPTALNPDPKPKREALEYVRKHRKKLYTVQDSINIHEDIREHKANKSPFIGAHHCSKRYDYCNHEDGRH